MQIVDAHHHLWKFNTEDFGWMDDSMQLLKKDYLPEQLEHQLLKAGVSGTVVVQARQKTEETDWLLKLSEKHAFILGVVGWLDLRSKRIEEQLEKYALHPKLVGIRHIIHDEPDLDFMLGDAFVHGISKLSAYDLCYDLLLFPEHLQIANKLVKMFPNQSFILDHIAKPLIKDKQLVPWKHDIQVLARNENVFCKISGLVTEADHDQWRYEDFVPFLDIILEAFGVNRLMLGSDWPVCRLAGEYVEVMEIPIRYFESLSVNEKRMIFSENCKAIYNLQL